MRFVPTKQSICNGEKERKGKENLGRVEGLSRGRHTGSVTNMTRDDIKAVGALICWVNG